jgi:hypothetical protein
MPRRANSGRIALGALADWRCRYRSVVATAVRPDHFYRYEQATTLRGSVDLEGTVALIARRNSALMSARRTGEGERHVRQREWRGWRPTHMPATQVTGKTRGIVGMRRIGIALARKARHASA